MNEAPDAPSGEQISLAQALIDEHHAIDAGIDAFVSQAGGSGSVRDWAKPLVDAMTALRRHIYLEEEIVFPRIRTGGLQMAVMVMLREHGEIWRQMDELEAKLARPDADEPVRSKDDCRFAANARTAEQLASRKSRSSTHVDADLDWVQAQLKLLAEGVLPEGWVCERSPESVV